MAISQISTSNTFQQWLTSTQLLIDHANYFQNTSNLIFETANNITSTNTFIQSYVASAYNTANTVNSIANIANTTAYNANAVANFANATALVANSTAQYANTLATQLLNDIESGNVALEILNNTTTNANLYISFFEASAGLTTNVYVSSTKLNFNPSTGSLSAIDYKVNGVTVIDNNRNLVNLGSAVTIAQGGTGASDASTARTNLGLAIGTNVQAYSATLAAVSGGTYTGATSITTLGTIGTGTWDASTIAANRGGTGQSSYAIGDILYASSSSALAKLPSVATGNTLISGGVGSAPTWGKVGLTTHITGTLPVGNGGTNATTASNARINLGLQIGANVQAWSTNLDAFSAKAAPSGVIVGTTDTQTVNNKTMFSATLNGVTLNDGYTEEVFIVTGSTPSLSPTNGSIQTWTLSANSTPVAGTWNSGQSMVLMIDDGTGNYPVTWSSVGVNWKTNNGSAPLLNNSGNTAIVLWKVGSLIYGARVGNA